MIKPEIKRSKVVVTESQLNNLVRELRKVEEFAFDTETNSLKVNGKNNDFKCVGISISWSQYHNYYIPIYHRFDLEDILDERLVVQKLKPIFEREDIRLIGHNIKYDLHVLSRLGINIKTKDLWDTMIACWLIDENLPKGLKDCSARDLGVDQERINEVFDTVTKEEKKMFGLKGNQKPTFDLVRVENGSSYAIDDSFYTWCLYLKYHEQLEEEGMLTIFNKQYKPFVYTLFKMEERGVTVDTALLVNMREEMEEDLEALQYELYELAGTEFNANSNQQLAELLFGFEEYKNPNEELLQYSFSFPIVSKTKAGKPQTSNSVLEQLAKKEYKDRRKREGVRLVKKLLEFKKLRKLKTAFIDGLLEEIYDDGKVHPNFNTVGTTSGRISCSNPNLDRNVVGHYLVTNKSKVGEFKEALQVA